jgi:valyl-tRNA synthetase
MLNNEQFTSKAPTRVIEQQRAKKEQYEAQLIKVLEQIENLNRTSAP